MSEQFEKDLRRLEKLRTELEDMGYTQLKVIEGRGICGLNKYMFTLGLVYGLDYMGFRGRYCYPYIAALDAILALSVWDGKEDPPGAWIKHKGHSGEWENPKTMKNHE